MGAVGKTLYILYVFPLICFFNFTYGHSLFLMFQENTFAIPGFQCMSFSIVLSSWWAVMRIINGHQQSIENFCWHRILIAGAVVCLNVLFPVAMILMFLGGWINILASAVIYFLLICLPFGFVNILSEFGSPIKYTFSKTTKLTNLQKVLIFTFFTIMEVYYIYLCTWTHPSQNEYNIVKFLPGTIYTCPIINIMVIPPVVVACYAYNSVTVKLFQSEPGSELQFIGLKTWNPVTGVWEYDEKPEDHEVLEI